MYEATTQRRLFTLDEVFRMQEAGILDEDENYELLDGELLLMGKQGPEHAALTVVLRDLFVRVYGREGHVRDHTNLRLDDFNAPEPDVTVVRGGVRNYLGRLPSGPDVLLVAEIAVTSHARDHRKIETYARAGVPEYWILDVPARTLTVRRELVDGSYRDVRVLDDQDSAALPGAAESVRVADLLP